MGLRGTAQFGTDSHKAKLAEQSTVLTFADLPAKPPVLQFKPAGPMEVVFSHKRDACNSDDIPDEAAHAFRDAFGEVHLVASHHLNLAMTGPDLNHLHRVCNVLYAAGAHDAKPADFDDLGWIESFYTIDGKTIHGIVSMDYHPDRHNIACGTSPTDAHDCWYSALTQVDSTDGGKTFVAPPPGKKRFIAGAPYQFDPRHTAVTGALVPTQMVPWNGYIYALFWIAGGRDQRDGDCLVRTKNPGDPASWRAWDGRGFNAQFVDPYPTPPADPAAHTCTPVGEAKLRAPVRSLLFLPDNKGFVAVMLGDYKVNNKSVPAVIASTSTDLLHWSDPVPVIDVPIYKPGGCTTTPHAAVYSFPSVLDPDSPSLNFNTLGTHGYVYLTRYFYCEGLNRDLVRFPVMVNYAK
jgi:hypothetical protein